MHAAVRFCANGSEHGGRVARPLHRDGRKIPSPDVQEFYEVVYSTADLHLRADEQDEAPAR
jgi:hypothetical protein